MRYTRTILSAAIITTGALSGLSAQGQNAGMSPSGQEFVTKATVAGKTEVAAARVALKNSQADDVKAFAKQMITDHSKAGDELASIAKAKNLAVPTELDAKHQAVLDSLGNQSGAAFDAAYSKQMVADHADAVGLFKSEATARKSDPDLSGFAHKTLPTLEHHKSMADALAAHHASASH